MTITVKPVSRLRTLLLIITVSSARTTSQLFGRQICNLANDLRATQVLPQVKLSYTMEYLAQVHLDNLIHNNHDPLNQNCNLHSWTAQTLPTGAHIPDCCYPTDGCMTEKAQQVTRTWTAPYPGSVRENSFASLGSGFGAFADPERVLTAWQNSLGHRRLLLDDRAVVCGAVLNSTIRNGMIQNVALLWMGFVDDPVDFNYDGPPITATSSSTTATRTSSSATSTTIPITPSPTSVPSVSPTNMQSVSPTNMQSVSPTNIHSVSPTNTHSVSPTSVFFETTSLFTTSSKETTVKETTRVPTTSSATSNGTISVPLPTSSVESPDYTYSEESLVASQVLFVICCLCSIGSGLFYWYYNTKISVLRSLPINQTLYDPDTRSIQTSNDLGSHQRFRDLGSRPKSAGNVMPSDIEHDNVPVDSETQESEVFTEEYVRRVKASETPTSSGRRRRTYKDVQELRKELEAARTRIAELEKALMVVK